MLMVRQYKATGYMLVIFLFFVEGYFKFSFLFLKRIGFLEYKIWFYE